MGIYSDATTQIFIDGFLDCALWAELDDNEQALEVNYDLSDFDQDKLTQLKKECVEFFNDNIELLNRTPETYNYGHAGHDFWLTRNGHGAGFWDGDADPVGGELTEKCKKYKSVELYIGDDNKIYF